MDTQNVHSVFRYIILLQKEETACWRCHVKLYLRYRTGCQRCHVGLYLRRRTGCRRCHVGLYLRHRTVFRWCTWDCTYVTELGVSGARAAVLTSQNRTSLALSLEILNR